MNRTKFQAKSKTPFLANATFRKHARRCGITSGAALSMRQTRLKLDRGFRLASVADITHPETRSIICRAGEPLYRNTVLALASCGVDYLVVYTF